MTGLRELTAKEYFSFLSVTQHDSLAVPLFPIGREPPRDVLRDSPTHLMYELYPATMYQMDNSRRVCLWKDFAEAQLDTNPNYLAASWYFNHRGRRQRGFEWLTERAHPRMRSVSKHHAGRMDCDATPHRTRGTGRGGLPKMSRIESAKYRPELLLPLTCGRSRAPSRHGEVTLVAEESQRPASARQIPWRAYRTPVPGSSPGWRAPRRTYNPSPRERAGGNDRRCSGGSHESPG